MPTQEFDATAHPSFDGHQQVDFRIDQKTGLRSIIAIHDTTLGPALGGCRMWPYANDMDALDDVLRLSRGMTYKNALAGLPLGGGKAVIIADPKTDKSRALFEAFGDHVDSLGGRYITAEDVGITDADMEIVAGRTPHVRGIRATGLGDPSPFTAWGVFCAMRTAVGFALERASLAGLTVAVQGLGHVGGRVAALAHADGARLIVADIDQARVDEVVARTGATSVPVDRIHAVTADVFAPCALGGGLNETTVPQVRAGIVCGAANNQLRTLQDGASLMRRGILYAPDYLVNAGGVISIAPERPGMTADEMKSRIARIGDTLGLVLSRAKMQDLPPEVVADRMAEERIAAARRDRSA
ncbi:Glu/Leu/Phe/Val dehydrogenase dimerization domain-containing protein [Microbaculum sp. FT89]|uniref:Glu/Leu/Phe/Val dehydrogenase dimerization domain-containing protein n=1 Tax=Microbaculum sp. FT89 TaxID=3447298 RepID=UPI003F52BEE8